MTRKCFTWRRGGTEGTREAVVHCRARRNGVQWSGGGVATKSVHWRGGRGGERGGSIGAVSWKGGGEGDVEGVRGLTCTGERGRESRGRAATAEGDCHNRAISGRLRRPADGKGAAGASVRREGGRGCHLEVRRRAEVEAEWTRRAGPAGHEDWSSG